MRLPSRSLIFAVIMGLSPAISGEVFAQDATSDTSQVSDPAMREIDAAFAASKAAMMGSPSDALAQAEQAEALIQDLPESREKTIAYATALWLQSEALNRTNHADKAKPIVEAALLALETVETNEKILGDLLLAAGRIDQTLGNVQGALENYQAAHAVFREVGSARYQAITLQEIGGIYNDARDNERAISYYDEALSTYDEDPSFSMVTHNNRANALRGLKRFDEAIEHYNDALEIAKQFNSPLLNARILNNLAQTKFQNGDLDAALDAADRGLAQLPESSNNEWAPFLWGVKAQVALARGDVEQAEALISRTFAGQDLEQTSMPFRDMHETAYDIYRRLERYDLALQHLAAFKRLEDESLSIASSANLALMASQFDFATQRLRIEQLRRDEAERTIEIANVKSRQRNLIFGFIIGGGLIVFGFMTAGYISVRRSRDTIRSVNDKLHETNTQLERANRAKSEFLATTSHEIRTPLNGILGMSQVILQDQTLSDTLKDKLRVVLSAGNSMKAIVDDLLDVGKIETGRVTIETSETDLHKVFEDVCLLWTETADEKGLTFNCDYENCATRVEADGQRIRQIAFNLLSNAVKFTSSGEVYLKAETRSTPEGDLLQLDVRDTGIGIPPTELENIFKPFHQVDGAKTRQYAGTGLGLSICQSFAEAMGGSIEVESEIDKGSHFVVTIPLHILKPAEPAAQTEDSSAEGRGQVTEISQARIVILQPDFMEGMIFKAFFADEVADVEIVDSTAALKDAVESSRFDFAIAEYADALVTDFTNTELAGKSHYFLFKAPSDATEKSAETHSCIAADFTPEAILDALRLHIKRSVVPNSRETDELTHYLGV